VEKEGLTRDQLVAAIRNGRYEAHVIKSKKSKEVPISKLKRPKKATHLYKASVLRVIDGDTLYLRIDLGFAVFKEQRIRLAGIDSPALDQPNGVKAKNYVLKELASAPFIMVRTNKIDIYGRYVGDVFYSLKGESKDKIFHSGRYLNQEIVDRGLARII